MTVCDHAVDRIRHAVNRKGSQVRSSDAPVLLAIHASSLSRTCEDCDMALFGYGYERYDERGRFVETGFAPNGLFTEIRDTPPTLAGILAFLTAGFNTCAAPVLYPHPRFSGALPKAIRQLEQRMYHEASNTIHMQPSNAHGLLERLHLVTI